VLSLAALVGCQAGGLESAQNAPLETDAQKASYGIGLQIGGQIAPASEEIQMEAFLRGVQDAMAGRDPAVPQAELQTALELLSERVMTRQQGEMTATADRNAQEGAAYREQNAQKAGVTTTQSGLQYEVMRPGDGPRPDSSDMVTIHYKGTLIDGTQFDSSYDGGAPATFAVTGVIAGFSEGLQLMPVGSQYRFVIPGELAYGPMGSGQLIGPNATLIFEVEMLSIANDSAGAGPGGG
jgi:FKBP-type peptidyl-prolyl cis-trans isomerase